MRDLYTHNLILVSRAFLALLCICQLFVMGTFFASLAHDLKLRTDNRNVVKKADASRNRNKYTGKA